MTLFSLKSFQLHPGTVALYTGAAGVVIAIAGVLGTLVFALIYNLIDDVDYRVHTGQGTIDAKIVILAAGAGSPGISTVAGCAPPFRLAAARRTAY